MYLNTQNSGTIVFLGRCMVLSRLSTRMENELAKFTDNET